MTMIRRTRSRAIAAVGALAASGLVVAACSSSSTSAPASTTTTVSTGLPAVKHVFVIMVENEGYDATFANTANDPYLAGTLVQQGALLKNYYATGHFSLDNYDAFISGQPPNQKTQADCVGGYVAFPDTAGQAPWQGATGIQQGDGCVYPAAVQTLPGQLSAAGYTWKAYMEDMGNDPVRDGAPTSTCGHPPLNGGDSAVVAVPGDGYATRHDPFVYFRSITDSAPSCLHVVPLGSTTGAMPPSDTVGATGLATDLRSIDTTPNFSFISPNLCNDGHDFPCLNQPSPGTSQVADIESFLKTWVPLITSSPAFRKDGLLEITFDEADSTDSDACCNEPMGPSGTIPNQKLAQGGGHIGTVLISPFIKPGTVVTTPMNHYSSLASIESIFGLQHLGNAQTVTGSFDTSVFTNAHG